jgi:hypothetical protein
MLLVKSLSISGLCLIPNTTFGTNKLPKLPFGECSADDGKELNKQAGIFEK